MKILILTFYYEPDLCAGSFRNTALTKELLSRINPDDEIYVISTMPNRYSTFINEAQTIEKQNNLTIYRVPLPKHKSGFIDQLFAFNAYFWGTLKLVKGQDYDIIYASSSRLFTAFLGSIIARLKKKPLYIDIRDIFVDTMKDVLKNKVLKLLLIPCLKLIERFTINSATHLNLVSGGFEDYFAYFKGKKSFYTNGIDEEFLDEEYQKLMEGYQSTSVKVITYAGNIGEGQGLEKIIPDMAVVLGGSFKFRVIGDGGTKHKLEFRLEQLNVNNVELLPPVSRKMLKQYYAMSDYLFMHLNDYDAFKKVLPSKIFEYGATNKTIIAGVGGYAQQFVKDNVEDLIVFEPGDVKSFRDQMLKHIPIHKSRTKFIQKYQRDKIVISMATSVLNLRM